MSIAKSVEVTSSSTTSFEDAIKNGVAKVAETVNDIQSAWVKDSYVTVSDGAVAEFRVALKVTFLVA